MAQPMALVLALLASSCDPHQRFVIDGARAVTAGEESWFELPIKDGLQATAYAELWPGGIGVGLRIASKDDVPLRVHSLAPELADAKGVVLAKVEPSSRWSCSKAPPAGGSIDLERDEWCEWRFIAARPSVQSSWQTLALKPAGLERNGRIVDVTVVFRAPR